MLRISTSASASLPSLRRKLLMCVSRLRSSGKSCRPSAVRVSASRDTTSPGERINVTRITNSAFVSLSELSPSHASRRRRLTRKSPTLISTGSSPSGSDVRRKIALTRASSSRGLKGFAKLLQHVEAGQPGQHDVQDDEVVVFALSAAQALDARGHARELDALGSEVFRQHF